jgi:hypothetical protein
MGTVCQLIDDDNADISANTNVECINCEPRDA